MKTEPLKRELKIKEVIRVGPLSRKTGISIKKKGKHTRSRPCADTTRKWPYASHGKRPQEKPDVTAP